MFVVSRDGRWVITAGGDFNRRDCLGELKAHRYLSGQHAAGERVKGPHSADMVLELVAGPFKNADGIGAVRFSQDSKKLAVRLWTGHCLEVWDVQTQTRDVGVGKRAGGTMSVTPVFWTTKDRTLVTPLSFTDDEATTIYKFDASTLETAFEGHLNAVIGLVLSGDGALLVSASPGDSIKFLTFESR